MCDWSNHQKGLEAQEYFRPHRTQSDQLSLKPVQVQICDNICRIALRLDGISGGQKSGIVIRSLTNQGLPVVKPCWGTLDVPFTDHTGLVSSRMQPLWECLLRSAKCIRPRIHIIADSQVLYTQYLRRISQQKNRIIVRIPSNRFPLVS